MLARIILVVVVLAFAVTPAIAEKAKPLTVKDIKKLIENQVEEDLIITQTIQSGLAFDFDDKNVFKLMEAGASEALLIELMQKHGSKFQTTPDNIVKLQEKGASKNFITFLQNPATYTTKGIDVNGDLDLNINGYWSAKSDDTLNVFFGVYVDGEKRTTLSQWTEIVSVGASSGEVTTYKFKPDNITVANIPEGSHNIEIVMWSGTGVSTGRYPSAVIWSRSIDIVANERITINLEASGSEDTYSLR